MILVDRDTKVVVQGITGREGSFHTQEMLKYGTNIVAGITPGKGGTTIMGVPVVDTMEEALEYKPDATIIFVPARFAPDAIIEAADSGIKLIVTITEGIPIRDTARVKRYLEYTEARLIGPNCPGIITPGETKLGIMPGEIHTPGDTGIVSRSGTLTYEIVDLLTRAGIGQSTCIGIGGDPIIGTTFQDTLEMFEKDPATRRVVMVGEIGGTLEEEAAQYIETMKKPVTAYIVGKTAPPGKTMGHAGALITGGRGTASNKIKALKQAGATIAESPQDIVRTLKTG